MQTKMNSIYARKRKENEKGHSYFAEKRKRKSPHNISGFFLFHTYSVTKLLVIQCAAMHGAQKVISNNGFRMANCFCCLTQNVMVCPITHCRQELGLQQKSWKTARLFLQDRDQDVTVRPNQIKSNQIY